MGLCHLCSVLFGSFTIITYKCGIILLFKEMFLVVFYNPPPSPLLSLPPSSIPIPLHDFAVYFALLFQSVALFGKYIIMIILYKIPYDCNKVTTTYAIKYNRCHTQMNILRWPYAKSSIFYGVFAVQWISLCRTSTQEKPSVCVCVCGTWLLADTGWESGSQ